MFMIDYAADNIALMRLNTCKVDSFQTFETSVCGANTVPEYIKTGFYTAITMS